jgi:LysR family glycine cleavage system transcriptional activator
VRNLRAFCVAARQLSFKLAADELCLTPSAISHQIKELETTLGMRLFDRRTRALELTVAGVRLLGEVVPLLKGLDRALAQLMRSESREKLRVRAPALFVNELLIPRLEEFCTAHPSIDVQLDTRDPRPVTHPRRPTCRSCSPASPRRVSGARGCSRAR